MDGNRSARDTTRTANRRTLSIVWPKAPVLRECRHKDATDRLAPGQATVDAHQICPQPELVLIGIGLPLQLALQWSC
jgi:hypothetical protein